MPGATGCSHGTVPREGLRHALMGATTSGKGKGVGGRECHTLLPRRRSHRGVVLEVSGEAVTVHPR